MSEKKEMTREEVIKRLKRLKARCERLIASSKAGTPEEWRKDAKAIDAALSALRPVSRERVEKVWRGEWKPTEVPYMNECEDCSVCGYRTVWGHGFRFCPSCGAPMTDEAVQMVMERLEALHETVE